MFGRHAYLIAAVVGVILGGTVRAKDPEFNLERIYYHGFTTIKSFALIDVSLQGSAEKLGINENKITDFLRLRFKNSFAGMEFKEPDSLVVVMTNSLVAMEYGSIHVQVWTVGDDYPVAFHIQISSGNLINDKQYSRAVLGYGSKKNVPDTVRETIAEMVDELAISFFKARGEL